MYIFLSDTFQFHSSYPSSLFRPSCHIRSIFHISLTFWPYWCYGSIIIKFTFAKKHVQKAWRCGTMLQICDTLMWRDRMKPESEWGKVYLYIFCHNVKILKLTWTKSSLYLILISSCGSSCLILTCLKTWGSGSRASSSWQRVWYSSLSKIYPGDICPHNVRTTSHEGYMSHEGDVVRT